MWVFLLAVFAATWWLFGDVVFDIAAWTVLIWAGFLVVLAILIAFYHTIMFK